MKRYLITGGIGLCLCVLICATKGLFSESDPLRVYRVLCDAFFVPGALIFGVGCLILCANGGVFNGLSYGFKTLFALIKPGYEKDKKTYYEFLQERKEKRTAYGFLLITGGVFIIVSLAFLVLFGIAV